MRNAIAFFVLLMTLFAITSAEARGGQAADDCPAGSTDPDCVASKNGK